MLLILLLDKFLNIILIKKYIYIFFEMLIIYINIVSIIIIDSLLDMIFKIFILCFYNSSIFEISSISGGRVDN